MRTMLLLPILLVGASASAQPSAKAVLPPLVLHDRGEITDPSATPVCRDRIDKTREERGLPKLREDNAAPTDPLLIAAVDKRIGGCSVMVMRGNLADIRPLPKFQDGPAKRTPIGQ
jgi:hypothetical protein